MTSHITLIQHKRIRNYIIIASLKRKTKGKLINRIPGLRLLKSTLPGLALKTHVESLGKPRDVNKCPQSVAWSTDINNPTHSILYISASLAMSTSVIRALPDKLISKDIHLVFFIYQVLKL